jgi:uncharacterized membrane protein HdeD (DUF308 family)
MAHTASGVEFLEQRREAMSASLARNWWAVLLRGIVTFLFGLAAILLPGVTIFSLILVFAVYMLADGVLDIIAAVRAAQRHERWGLLVLEGVVDLIAGAIALFLPHAALFAFVVLAAFWAVVSGVLMLASAFRLHREHGRIWLIVGGVASIVWGVLLGLFPVAALVVMTWWLGAYALVFGASLVALAVTLRVRRREPAAAAPAA